MTLRLSILSAFAATLMAVTDLKAQHTFDYEKLSPKNPDRENYLQILRDSAARNPKSLFSSQYNLKTNSHKVEFPSWFAQRKNDNRIALSKFSDPVYDSDGQLVHVPGLALYTKQYLYKENGDSTVFYTVEEEQRYIDNNRNGEFDYTFDPAYRFNPDANEMARHEIVISKCMKTADNAEIVLTSHSLAFERFSQGSLMVVSLMRREAGIAVRDKPALYENGDTMFLKMRAQLLRKFHDNPELATMDTTHYQSLTAHKTPQ